MKLTEQQKMYRQYLKTPLWKEKRKQALEHYGCICNRCKEHGTDVHHITYARVGGQELLSDFEILCRECHTAHHKIERENKKKTNKNKKKTDSSINRLALARYLNTKQRKYLEKKFNMSWGDIYCKLSGASDPNKELDKEALKLLGKNSCYVSKRKTKHIIKRKRIYM